MTVQTTDAGPDTAATDSEVDATDPADTDAGQDGPEVDPEAAADDATPDEQVGREAARYRRRLREAEAANEALVTEHAAALASAESAHAATTATLMAQRMAVVDAAISAAKFNPETFRPHLLVALGETGVNALLGQDGTVDVGRLGEAVRSTAAAFTPEAAGVRPNRQQGNPSTGNGGGATWSSVLGGRR